MNWIVDLSDGGGSIDATSVAFPAAVLRTKGEPGICSAFILTLPCISSHQEHRR